MINLIWDIENLHGSVKYLMISKVRFGMYCLILFWKCLESWSVSSIARVWKWGWRDCEEFNLINTAAGCTCLSRSLPCFTMYALGCRCTNGNMWQLLNELSVHDWKLLHRFCFPELLQLLFILHWGFYSLSDVHTTFITLKYSDFCSAQAVRCLSSLGRRHSFGWSWHYIQIWLKFSL